MVIEYGRIEGDISLDYKFTLQGMVIGNITVVKDGNLILHGTCGENITIEKGGRAYLYGTVNGNVLNHGYLEVDGVINGYLYTSEDANTIIDPSAVVQEVKLEIKERENGN